jgi:SsrA-binding protein
MSKDKSKGNKDSGDSNNRVIARNRKASHNYELLKTYDAGLVLMGSEIKSIRDNRVSISDGFVQERDGELWVLNMHIAQYNQAAAFGHDDPLRPRKLLLHRREIAQILGRTRDKGYTVVPTRLFLTRGKAKLQIAVARGKKLHDKRDAKSKRDAQRQIERALKERI